MATAELRPSAEEDLDDAWLYVAQDAGPDRADALIRRIGASLELLAERPMMGPATPHIADGLRKHPVGSYVVYYMPAPAGVEVVRVLHSSRDVERVDF